MKVRKGLVKSEIRRQLRSKAYSEQLKDARKWIKEHPEEATVIREKVIADIAGGK